MVRVGETKGGDASPHKKLVKMQGNGRGLPGGEQQTKTSENAENVPEPTTGRSNPVLALPSSSTSPLNTYNYVVPIDENEHRYVGLVNQAMTCYLNSLVQSLYMTPEFRNAMYEWEYVSSIQGKLAALKKGESSIPCQLQKLFLLLQTTDNDALETRDLTQSFGWSASEAYDQHDVQELCRLMFDALEHKWKGTKHEKLIQDLYRGTMEDVVECLACGKENVRTDYFLDLPLAVKPFGVTTAFKSVQEALHAFIQPELLDGSNQYMCENCQKKQDAHKGLRITQFPYLLTIQLKRFDFDYNTMHRIKLNDKMSFPDVLDLNAYVYQKEGKSEQQPKTGPIPMKKSVDNKDDQMDFGSPPSKAHKPENETKEDEPKNVYEHCENWQVRVGQCIDHKAVDELLKNGENVYELFSVMVHSGSAAGGHYFAYIKNLEQDKWYSFNDTRVDFANVAEIERSFGGHSGGWNTSNTNAYMLMYRKIDRNRNCNFLHTDQLPAHIQNLQQKWKQQEKEAEEQRKLQESMLTVRVKLNYPFPSIVKNPKGEEIDILRHRTQIVEDFVEYVTEISRYQTIATVYNQALDFFTERAKSHGLTIARKTTRMIFYEKNYLRKTYITKSDMEKKLNSVFDPNQVEPCPMFTIRFLLDSRIASVPFNIEPRGGVLVQIQRVDIGKRTTVPEVCVYIGPDARVIQARMIVGQQFRDGDREVLESRFVLESRTRKNEFVNVDGTMNGTPFLELVREHFGMSTPIIYYDGGLDMLCSKETKEATEIDRKQQFEKSSMFDILDRKHFSAKLTVRLPSPDEITRAASVSGVSQGPSWAETCGSIKEEGEMDTAAAAAATADKVWNEPRSTNDMTNMSTVSKDTQDQDAVVDTEEDVPSGRASTATMGSNDMSMEDLDGNELGMVSGSFCNNTPLMSPSVSENDEYESRDREITNYELNNQLNAEMTIQYVYNSQFNESMTNKNLRIEETPSEVQSAASSGQSTLVPSTSSNVVTQSSSIDSLDGKIIVLSASETHRILDIDSRLKVGELKKWVASQLHMNVGEFVVFAHTNDFNEKGYESHATDDDTVPNAFQTSTISIKLRPPLKIDERMIQIIQFDMQENTKEKWKTLFEIPATQKTLIGDVMLQCLRMYKEVYGTELTPQQVRMRDFSMYSGVNHNGGVLLLNNPLEKREGSWYGTIYLQIITDESLIGKPGVPLFARRFRPSTVEVSATHEILVNPKAENQVLSFFEGISKISQIPVDRIAVTDLKTYGWMRWPYWRNRLDLLDGKMFIENLHKTADPTYIDSVGTRVIYYKDAQEEAKILSEEERKQIKIKENGQTEVGVRRKERPLRIQMSSVSES